MCVFMCEALLHGFILIFVTLLFLSGHDLDSVGNRRPYTVSIFFGNDAFDEM